jgi:E3 ubiquitin-protein ligase SHPRH
MTRRNVGALLVFGLLADDDDSVKSISISSQPGSTLGILQTTIRLSSDEISRSAAAILRATGRNFRKSDREGALWTLVDIQLARHGGDMQMKITLELHWNETLSIFGNLRSTHDRANSAKVMGSFFPRDFRGTRPERSAESWSPLEFYEAAHVPDKDDTESSSIEVPDLKTALYPYQKRTLQWLLNREGVSWSQSQYESRPGLRVVTQNGPEKMPESFREVKDLDGEKAYISDLYQIITRDYAPFTEAERLFRGGILAEEMGLGKTLEIIGLVLLHRRGACPPVLHTFDGEELRTTPATLIVTPESLRQQWLSELTRHAPDLRVKHYTGCKTLSEDEERSLVDELAEQDVVITTYNLLSSELHFAEKPPDRSSRHERRFHRPKSPLVQLSWWRVCLDEAQMIENGLSKAAVVARVIPRMNAWGITGTPVKSDVKDLLGLARFLRYEPFASHPQIWQSLVTEHKSSFQDLFGRISLRHTKRMVRDEIALPSQSRYVITMPFTAVEEQHYQSLVQQMAEECGLDISGIPLVDEWDPDENEEAMRTWLNRLRQTALHPEVGAQNRRALGHKAGPMRTVDEVLNAMIEQSDGQIRTDQRALFSAKLTRGQLLENGPRVREALAIWKQVGDEVARISLECRKNLQLVMDEAKKTLQSGSQQDSDSSDDEAEDKLEE